MKKEFARFFGDKRLVFTTILMPGLMIYILYTLLGQGIMKQFAASKDYVYQIYTVDLPEAFFMDKLLRKIGLSGRSIVPMLIGFGCTVPAVMATRTLPSERDRKMTILLTPFMSCSAKLPIYAFFVSAFFPEYGALVMCALYLGGIVIGILVALLYRKTLFRGDAVPFVMELPNYRLPGLKNVMM